MFPIRVSTPQKEGVLQVSKWTKAQVFLSAEEMEDLVHSLGSFYFVVVSEPVMAESAVIPVPVFLQKYAEYVFSLKNNLVPSPADFRRFFSCAMAVDLDSFYAMSVGNDKFLIKPRFPVVQLQTHHCFYSNLDGKFYPMVLSEDSISWGIQFSYPQLAQDPKTRQIIKVKDMPSFPNTALFTQLMKWLRNFTLPTPFEVKGKRINSPIRIGKKSLAWIKNHPQLKQKDIQVGVV